MKRILSVLLVSMMLLVTLMVFPQREASACSCAVSDPHEKLENYAAVFVGKVLDKGGTVSSRFGNLREYTFEVKEAWKGVEESPFSLYAYDGGDASCGYPFDVGQTYLVYSYQDKDGTLQTNLCSGNVVYEHANDDLRQLGLGTSINTNEGIAAEHENRFTSMYYWIGFALALIAAVAVILWRRRKRAPF
ncbi:hypothetical protein [Cohnella sp. AR92]|uniref:hypothetical protein n=1 Tax=Cohnella sp. AR92 TaxID=648716 RepID=UPI000F8D0306|nr:hypothetical protein [Cohnella sp. AR92]RUS45826.1 hypothetical protein ELR57_18415 [Cohnella sp. AR92]